MRFLRSIVPLSLLGFAACSSSGASPGGGNDAGPGPFADGGRNADPNGAAVDEGGGPPPRQCTGFGAVANWAVPDGAYSALVMRRPNDAWVTLDLDGDGHLDLVRTQDPKASGRVAFGANGAAYWEMYKGGPNGFAPTASRWSVPDAMYSLTAVSELLDRWLTLDLDGDRVVDLVRTRDPKAPDLAAFTANGGAYWEMYKGGTNGFASTATPWSVPDASYASAAESGIKDRWVTIDLDGDRRVDLVRTVDPKAQDIVAFTANGKPHWQVFKGGANGFASAASAWSVPDASYVEVALNRLKDSWVTLDLDGDRVVDLVRTQDPDRDGVVAFSAGGGAHWRMFKGGRDGFASEPTPWSVPDAVYAATAWSRLKDTWITFDLDGDHHVDLVRTQDPNADGVVAFTANGGAYWEIFKGGANGFASTPSRWSVPGATYAAIASSSAGDSWVTLDLDADGCVDLVRTRDPKSATGSAFPGPSWQSYRGR